MYWVLLGFTVFFWVFWVFIGFTGCLLGFSVFFWVLIGFTGFYWVLLGFTGFYWVLLGFNWFYWVLLFVFLPSFTLSGRRRRRGSFFVCFTQSLHLFFFFSFFLLLLFLLGSFIDSVVNGRPFGFFLFFRHFQSRLRGSGSSSCGSPTSAAAVAKPTRIRSTPFVAVRPNGKRRLRAEIIHQDLRYY